MAQLVDLPHGLIQDGGNDSSMAVSGRTGVTLAQSKTADKAIARLIVGKFQAHPIGIIRPARETVVSLEFDVAGVVPCSVTFTRHWF